MNPRTRPRRPASIGSNQASPANSPCSAAALLLSLSMAWSPPALERRSWLVEQAGDYATQISYHTRDGTERTRVQSMNDFAVFGSMVVGSFLSGGLLNSYGWEIVCLISFAPLLLAALTLWTTGALRLRPAIP